MKVTISFHSTKIVVPCGDGDISVREATSLAVTRYKKAVGKPGSFWVSVSSLKSHEGGMLDPDDLICDVCDDREQLMALFDEQPFSGHVGDGMSSSSDSTSDKDPSEKASEKDSPPQVRKSGDPSSTATAGVTSGSVQAAVASINAKQKRLNFTKQRSKTSHDDDELWAAARRSRLDETNARTSLRKTMSKEEAEVNIVHTHPRLQDPCSDREDAAESSLNVLRRREPLGASANKPDRSPKREIVPILKNSKSATSLATPPSFEIAIRNEIGPLGIHVVPCDEDGRLVVQGIEPGGRIDRDGRLAIGDEIIRINGCPLEETSFGKAQEVFKEALFARELRLRVVKGGRREEEEERPASASKAHTLPRAEKLAAGTKITTAVHANNTRKIGKVIPISLTKGPGGLGFSVTTRDNALGGNTPIYIKNIMPKGAAIEEGTLKPGDRLLEVNEVCVDGMSQSDVVSLLRNAPSGSVLNLVVSRHVTTTGRDDPKQGQQMQIQFENVDGVAARSQNEPKEESMEPPPSLPSSASPTASTDRREDAVPPDDDFHFPWRQRQILTFDIPVHDSERAGLGVSVKGKTTSSGKDGVVDLGIFVKSVLHGGAASRDGRLKTNDQLVNINGSSLLGKANPEAMESLRKAMHEEGPIPGVISLTVARRHEPRRSSASSLVTSSDEDLIREYNVANSRPMFKMPASCGSQLSSLVGTRNPVVDRLMGKEASSGIVPSNLRNDSYHMATHDTLNATTIKDAEATLEAQPFSRDQPGRQSMSEKRHATLDAKSTDTYQKRKKAREDRERQQQRHRAFVKSASLESLQPGEEPSPEEREALRNAYVRASSVRVSRSRGCNESFRAAVDRSYDNESDGFVVIQDLDSANDENVNSSNEVVMRRHKSADAKERKANRNSRLLTGLSNMFKGSAASKKPIQAGAAPRRVPTASGVSPQSDRSGTEADGDRNKELQQHWYNHHMRLHQSKLQHRSRSQPRPHKDYEHLASSMMRPGSRVGIADLGASSDYDVLQRLRHQQQRPPPPPPPPVVHPYGVYNGYPPMHHGLPVVPHQAPPSGHHHVRTSSNLSSGSSSAGHHHNPSAPQSKQRLRPKSNYYEYETYSSYSPGSSGGNRHAAHHHQRMVERGSNQQQQQMYSLPRMQQPLQQQYFQPSDYN